MLGQPFEVEREVLDARLAKVHPVAAELHRHLALVFARQGQHVVVHVDPDDLSLGPHDLGREVADLAGAAAEVEDDIARPHVRRRVTATVIALDDLLGQEGEERGVVAHRAAQRRLLRLCALRVTVQDLYFDVHRHPPNRACLL